MKTNQIENTELKTLFLEYLNDQNKFEELCLRLPDFGLTITDLFYIAMYLKVSKANPTQL